MRISTGDAVVLLDGDLQDPPELIAEFVKKWREGYDVVYGERVRARGVARRCSSPTRRFYRLFHAHRVRQGPARRGRLLAARPARGRRAQPAPGDAPLHARAARVGRASGRSACPTSGPSACSASRRTTLRRTSAGRGGRSSPSPTRRSTRSPWLALAVTSLAFLGAIGADHPRLVAPDLAPRGISTILVLVLFMGGIQLLCLSIIGSYLAHIYEEVKAPTAVRRRRDPQRARAARGARQRPRAGAGRLERDRGRQHRRAPRARRRRRHLP